MYDCPKCLLMRKEILRLQLELKEEQARSNAASDLLIKGEMMRERMMLNAILAGHIPNAT